MRQADFKARIKKIEIANRTLTDGWAQAIRVILDDIELSDENLLELKQFRPNEPISVIITPVQVSITDCATDKNDLLLTGSEDEVLDEDDQPDDDYAFKLVEGEPSELSSGMVVKEWKF